MGTFPTFLSCLTLHFIYWHILMTLIFWRYWRGSGRRGRHVAVHLTEDTRIWLCNGWGQLSTKLVLTTFFIAEMKYPIISSLRRGVSSQFRGCNPSWQGRQSSRCVRWLVTLRLLSGSRERQCWCSDHFLLSIQSRSPAHLNRCTHLSRLYLETSSQM